MTASEKSSILVKQFNEEHRMLTVSQKLDLILERLDAIELRVEQIDSMISYSQEEFEDDNEMTISFEPADELLEEVMEKISDLQKGITDKSGDIISVDFQKNTD